MSTPVSLRHWEELAATHPDLVTTMRAYLDQIGCVLRPGSVVGADLTLRAFATYLSLAHPQVRDVGQVNRTHIEGYKLWIAARPGQHQPQLAVNTLVHYLGGLRMFFVRITEWDWEQAPARMPMFLGDLPRTERPLPKALDDAAAGQLLRAAHEQKRLLIGVTVEVLLRTGLRVGEYTALTADAVMTIGTSPWLHVPVGKLHEDRYLPLHPHLVKLIDDYRDRYVPDSHPLLLPRENGRALDRHTVTRMINKAGAAAGLGHIHPHVLRHTLATQAINRGMSIEAIAAAGLGHIHPHVLRHTLATQAINRGMSIEAIAAMLGHHSLDMTLRYAKIANRTVADEYFAVAEKVDALYNQTRSLPADALGPKMARLRREHYRHLGNGYCTRPPELDCAFEDICENCTFFQTSIEFRPTLQAQHDDAAAKGQTHRADLFTTLLHRTDHHEAS